MLFRIEVKVKGTEAGSLDGEGSAYKESYLVRGA